MVKAACHRILRDAALAEDMAQDVFLLLVRKLPSLPRRTNLGGWGGAGWGAPQKGSPTGGSVGTRGAVGGLQYGSPVGGGAGSVRRVLE